MTRKPEGSKGGTRALKTRVKKSTLKESSRRWLERHMNDPYVQRSKADGYRSRAAYKLIEIDDRYKLLKPGMNQIAVMLRNNFNFDWDDVAFDVSLKTIVTPSRAIGLSMTQPGANPNAAQSLNSQNEIGVSVTVPGETIWRVESADRLNGPWQLMQVISNTGPGTVTLPDLGQNGRLPPSATPTRFYRLLPN